METNIVLIGMPASGKSTIGLLLAEKLADYTLIDTDSLIEKTSGAFKKLVHNMDSTSQNIPFCKC